MLGLARGSFWLLVGLAVGPGPPPAPAPRLASPPRLAWVSSWEGNDPSLFTDARGGFILTVLGGGKLNGRSIGAPPTSMKGSVPGGAPLWVARLGPEGSLRSAVPTATPFASAQAVAVSDGGNVFGWAARSKEGPTEIVRIAPDGAESSLLPIDAAYNWGTRGFDPRTGRLAFGLARKGEGPTQRMLVLDERGALRRTLEVQSTKDSHIGAVAIGSDGSLILAVGTWAPARVVGASTPIELASPPPGGATWLIALDARGAPSWSRALTADGRITVSAIEVDPDGTLFVTGECEGALHAEGAVVRPPVVPAAKAAKPPEYAPFSLSLKASTGEPIVVRRDKGPFESRHPWTPTREVRVSYLKATDDRLLSAVDRAGREIWRTQIGASSIRTIAVLRDGSFLLRGSYDLMLTVPGVDPPAVLLNAMGGDFLAFYTLGPGPSAPTVAPETSPWKTAFSDTRRRAQKAFRAKRFDEACRFYAAAQRLEPASAANMVDLALCLQRWNFKEGAVRANRYAIRLASGTDRNSDKAESVRRAAYYNLGRLESGPEVGNWLEPCIAIESWFGCGRPVHACGRANSTGGTLGITDYSYGRFALDPDGAKFEDGEYLGGDLPEIGSKESDTSGSTGAPSYDVTLGENWEGREWNKARDELLRTSQSSRGCRVVHTDGCSGYIGLVCSFDEEGDRKPHHKVIELTLGSK